MLATLLLSLVSLSGLVAAQADPTSWIDTNPKFAKETFVTVDGSSTVYIGPTNGVLDVSTVTATISGKVKTVTTSLGYIVETATAAAGDHVAHDIGIELSAELSDKLTNLAIKHCGTPSKRMRRTTINACANQFAQDATTGENAIIGSVGAPNLPTIAGDVGQLIKAAKSAGLIIPANEAAYAFAFVALAAYFAKPLSGNGNKIPLNIIIPATAIVHTTTTAPMPAQTSKCPDAPVDCEDTKDCNGNANKICQSGQFKGCNCRVIMTPIWHPGFIDLDAQQDLLAAFEANVTCDKNGPVDVDLSVVRSYTEFFCNNATLSRDDASLVSYVDFGGQIAVPSKGQVGAFYFQRSKAPCALPVQQCTDMFNFLMSSCKSSGKLAGAPYIESTCGTYQVLITTQSALEVSPCSGPGTTGNSECTAYCMATAQRHGICQDTGGSNECLCRTTGGKEFTPST